MQYDESRLKEAASGNTPSAPWPQKIEKEPTFKEKILQALEHRREAATKVLQAAIEIEVLISKKTISIDEFERINKFYYGY